MIIYEVRYDQGDGTEVEWCRNKAQAEKRKREISEWPNVEWAVAIRKHVIEPNKDDIVGFLNMIHYTDNG